MRKLRYILVLVLGCLLCVPSYAQKKEMQETAQRISAEQEQQFTYYWYAAKQAIVEDRFDEAYVLLKFCNAINPYDGATLCFLGILEQGIGNTFKGLIMLQEAFELDPYDQWFHYAHALQELETPMATLEAQKVMEKAHEVQKKSGKADENLLGELQDSYLKTGKWKEALEVQDEIDGMKGYDMYSAILRYRIYMAVDKPKQALAEIDRYLELDPTDIRFLMFRMDVMQQTKYKQKELYALFDRILAIDPLNLQVLNNYAYHLATHKGDLKKAEQMSAITIREEPNNPVYLDTYGWILHLKGQHNLAYFYLKKAQWYTNDETQAEIEQHLKEVEKKIEIYEK